MSAKTSIEWTDRTWNPVRGCSMAKGSENGGCLNCYAAMLAARNLPGMRSPSTGKPFAVWRESGPRWTGVVEPIPAAVTEPLSWRKPQRIFVNSMSDLFHEALSDEAIADVFLVMALAKRHTFQVLTKRAGRMAEWCSDASRRVSIVKPKSKHEDWIATRPLGGFPWPLPNVWLGVSCEDQKTADERIPLLLQAPAAVRFVSYEPALGPIDFTCIEWQRTAGSDYFDALQRDRPAFDDVGLNGAVLDQIIVGGESGHGARPFKIDWARSVVNQCKTAGVAAFVKQLGALPIAGCGQCGRSIGRVRGGFVDACGPTHAALIAEGLRIRDSKGGDMAEWPEDIRVRKFPAVRA